MMAQHILQYAVAAVVFVGIALPRSAFACGGECATVGGDTGATLLAIVAGAWALIRAGGYVRQRVVSARLRQASDSE